MRTRHLICDFTLIVVVYMFLVFPQYTELFAHSIPGRILAILMIMVYAAYDLLYGLAVCILVVTYYFYCESCRHTEGFVYEYQRESGKTDDFYKMPHDATPYQSFEGEPSNQRGDAETQFIKRACPKGVLTQTDSRGNFPVPTEMAGHIYPELAYPGPPCNPCSADCAFKVVDKRLRAEEELVHPKSANEWFDTILERLTNAK